MKYTKQILIESHIVNSFDIAKRGEAKLFIGYVPAITGRGLTNARWKVYGMNFKTDPDSAWYDYSQKAFNVYRRDEKPVKLQEAFDWCKEQYGITEWERDVFGDYQIKGTIAKALAQ